MGLGPTIPQAAVDWSVAVASRHDEFPEPVALDASGCLPPELAGTLYLVGPARHEAFGQPAASLLDGDGMAHAVRLGPDKAEYLSRFVETAKKAKEDKAQRRLYASFGAPAPGGRLRRAVRSRPRSPANAGVVVHQGRLFALWDGAPPYELDPATLATLGPSRLDGLLRGHFGFASSPVVDPATGDLWNVGGRPGLRLRLGVYRWPADGPPQLVGQARLPYRSFVRTLALTETRAVFVLSPLVPQTSAAGWLGQRSTADTLRWRPELGAWVGLVDRATGAFRLVAAPPLLAAAVAHAFDDGDDVVIDLCTYPDPSMITAARGVTRGERTATGYATLERLVLRADGEVERSLRPPLDWPTVAQPAWPGPDARVFGLNLNPLAGFPGTLAAVDPGEERRIQWVPPLAHEVAGPPTAVVKAGARHGGQAWVLSVVTDLAERRSHLRVYDGEDLSAPPVYAVALPAVIPFGARGAFSGQRPQEAPSPAGK